MIAIIISIIILGGIILFARSYFLKKKKINVIPGNGIITPSNDSVKEKGEILKDESFHKKSQKGKDTIQTEENHSLN